MVSCSYFHLTSSVRTDQGDVKWQAPIFPSSVFGFLPLPFKSDKQQKYQDRHLMSEADWADFV